MRETANLPLGVRVVDGLGRLAKNEQDSDSEVEEDQGLKDPDTHQQGAVEDEIREVEEEAKQGDDEDKDHQRVKEDEDGKTGEIDESVVLHGVDDIGKVVAGDDVGLGANNEGKPKKGCGSILDSQGNRLGEIVIESFGESEIDSSD